MRGVRFGSAACVRCQLGGRAQGRFRFRSRRQGAKASGPRGCDTLYALHAPRQDQELEHIERGRHRFLRGLEMSLPQANVRRSALLVLLVCARFARLIRSRLSCKQPVQANIQRIATAFRQSSKECKSYFFGFLIPISSFNSSSVILLRVPI